MSLLVCFLIEYNRPPDHKSSSNVSLPFAWTTGPATDPSIYDMAVLIIWQPLCNGSYYAMAESMLYGSIYAMADHGCPQSSSYARAAIAMLKQQLICQGSHSYAQQSILHFYCIQKPTGYFNKADYGCPQSSSYARAAIAMLKQQLIRQGSNSYAQQSILHFSCIQKPTGCFNKINIVHKTI